MGTRGAVVLVVYGNEKTMYNHWDSYPSGLGEDVLGWITGAIEEGREDEFRFKTVALQPVPDREPTPEEMERYAEYRDPNVNGGEGWYSLLRHAQGDLTKTLTAGLYEPANDFPLDSLFCEWAYVVDFDARTFEAYVGFQRHPHREGRWAGQKGRDEYYPVRLVSAWSFDSLPDNLKSIEDADEDES